MNETALDNPAWASLTTKHAEFAKGGMLSKRYPQHILPFAACYAATENAIKGLDPFAVRGESFYIIGNMPVLPVNWVLEYELPCAQMLLTGRKAAAFSASTEENAAPVSKLGEADAVAMFDLINSMQPGYYKTDTRLLGDYYGIKQEGRLVAMAGERMRLTGFTELSAICTDADYAGRGYAQTLIKHLCQLHAKQGIVSFLHVALSNRRAIRLYEHMGFEQRRAIHFRRIRKNL